MKRGIKDKMRLALMCLFLMFGNGQANNLFKVVTANINLMPQGLNLLTSGQPTERATQIVDALLSQQSNADVYVLQELYDEDASNKLIDLLKNAGYDYFPGPTKEQLELFWKKKGMPSDWHAHDSGQAVFIKKNGGLRVESYDVLAFIDAGIEGIGILESYVPKGVIHTKISCENSDKALSIFSYHLQAELGFFAIDQLTKGNVKEALKSVCSDIIHLQPFQSLREKCPSYVENLRIKQMQAAVAWIDGLRQKGTVADQVLHIGDFNLIAGKSEYYRLVKTLNVVAATDKELVTIGNPINTTWNRFLRPGYIGICKYVNNYGWMDLALVNEDFKKKVHSVDVVDLKNTRGKSVSDHSSVYVIFDRVFEVKK